jgi:hypothetical protein
MFPLSRRTSAAPGGLRTRVQPQPVVFVVLFSSLLASSLSAQSPAPESRSSGVVPENGFLSPEKYTNAFFGFSLPLPKGAGLREQTLSLNRGTRDHFLLGYHSPNEGLTTFTITAREAPGGSEKEARKDAAGPNSSKPKEAKIGGRTFWRSESPKKLGAQTLVFSTALDDYALRFEIISFNPDITVELERSIEQLTFFDPSRAKVMAGADGKPYTTGVSEFPTNRIAQLAAGSISGNVYHNEDLGFRYEFPRDWVVMSKTAQINGAPTGHQFIWGNSPTVQQEHEAASQCSRDLLFVTRHLEEDSKVEQFNSKVLLTVTDPNCAQGSRFPKTVDDREAIQQIARQVVQYFRTSAMSPAEPARVRAFNNAGRTTIEISQSFAVTTPGHPDPTAVLFSTLVMQIDGYWVIWIFSAGDKQELEELRNTKIFFDVSLASPVGLK